MIILCTTELGKLDDHDTGGTYVVTFFFFIVHM